MLRAAARLLRLAAIAVWATAIFVGRELHPILIGGYSKGDHRHPLQVKRRTAALEHEAFPEEKTLHEKGECEACDMRRSAAMRPRYNEPPLPPPPAVSRRKADEEQKRTFELLQAGYSEQIVRAIGIPQIVMPMDDVPKVCQVCGDVDTDIQRHVKKHHAQSSEPIGWKAFDDIDEAYYYAKEIKSQRAIPTIYVGNGNGGAGGSSSRVSRYSDEQGNIIDEEWTS